MEAANFAVRYCPQAKSFYDRKKSKTNRVLAIKALAHKLARACYHMLRDQKPFDVHRVSGNGLAKGGEPGKRTGVKLLE